VLLHLSRYPRESIDEAVIDAEIDRACTMSGSSSWKVPEAVCPSTLDAATLSPVADDCARRLHERYHYLGSFRNDGVHLGLALASADARSADGLLSLVTLAPLDVVALIQALPADVRPEQVLVLARLLAASTVPNVLSRTLGRVFAWIRQHRPSVRMLVTYLDPNVGFDGAVYRATNWTLIAREPKQRYLFLDGAYVTERSMLRRYGTSNTFRLRALLGSTLSTSVRPLLPLDIYGHAIDPTLVLPRLATMRDAAR
jgi:hypothetical protein